MKRVYEKQNVTPTESTGDTPYRNTHGFCYTGSDKACVITKTRWTLSLKGKDHSANTKEKSGGEARRDDPIRVVAAREETEPRPTLTRPSPTDHIQP